MIKLDIDTRRVVVFVSIIALTNSLLWALAGTALYCVFLEQGERA